MLLRNTGLLPCPAETVQRIAVIGDNAANARTQGGGSATVIPAEVVSPLAGIRAAFPEATVAHALGAAVQQGLTALPPGAMVNPVTGTAGARVRFLDEAGVELFAEDRFASDLVHFGGSPPVASSHLVEIAASWNPERTEEIRLGVATVGRVRIHVDGEQLVDTDLAAGDDDLAAAFLAPPVATADLHVVAGVAVDVRVEIERELFEGGLGAAMSLTVGTQAVPRDPDALIAEAAELARSADLVVVVVGTNAAVESEGFDRTDLTLPGRQDDRARAVAAANDRTVVVVNAGAPVQLPLRDHVAAVLLSYFGGQESGHALADVLTGEHEPGGRLSTTWPAATSEVPVLGVTPVDGALIYDEGVHVGYRAWLRVGRTPAYPFSHGLGYTSWALGAPRLARTQAGFTVTTTVRNTGSRPGKHVVQDYAEHPVSAVDRPVRWVVGFAVVRAAAGSEAEAFVEVPLPALAHRGAGWQVEPGTYTLRVGSSVADLLHAVDLAV